MMFKVTTSPETKAFSRERVVQHVQGEEDYFSAFVELTRGPWNKLSLSLSEPEPYRMYSGELHWTWPSAPIDAETPR